MRAHSSLGLSGLALALAACSSSGSGASPAAPLAKANVARAPASGAAADALPGAVAANNAFALDLYSRAVSASSNANFLSSPISASLALTMTYAGAQGETATQMATALHYGAAASTIFDGQNALTQALASRGAAALAQAQGDAPSATPPSASDYELEVVNSVWGQSTYPWQSAFLNTLAADYGTGVYLEDFTTQYAAAEDAINNWVSDETDDKINDLLPPNVLDASTRMVLVNAVHLKFPWLSPFEVSATQPATFTRTDGTTVSTSFMNQQESFAYVDDGKAQIVSLPLAGQTVSVNIALPHGDLAGYEAGLTADSAVITGPQTYALVALSLPKVSFTSASFSLASVLKAMGMTDAFDKSTADFSGLCAKTPDGDRLYIADVLQKAMVAMAETGVEAAAATAVIVGGANGSVSAPPPQPVPMIVNRPYLLSIVDATGAVLFLGHIADPTAG